MLGQVTKEGAYLKGGLSTKEGGQPRIFEPQYRALAGVGALISWVDEIEEGKETTNQIISNPKMGGELNQESEKGAVNLPVQKNLISGFYLFVLSEVMIFFAAFWAFLGFALFCLKEGWLCFG